ISASPQPEVNSGWLALTDRIVSPSFPRMRESCSLPFPLAKHVYCILQRRPVHTSRSKRRELEWTCCQGLVSYLPRLDHREHAAAAARETRFAITSQPIQRGGDPGVACTHQRRKNVIRHISGKI